MKSKKKFVLAGLLLLAAIITGLTLTGCETEVDPSTPQQEQPDGNTGNSGGRNTQQPGGENGGNTGSGGEDEVGGEKPVTYTVTFNANGGSAVASQTMESGKTASTPAKPELEGSWFLGWYGDKELTTEFDFSAPVTADTTVYAKWSYRLHTKPTKLSDYTSPNYTGNEWSYVEFGDWPQTVKEDGVTVNETKSKTMGGLTYCLGSDGNHYVKQEEKAYGADYTYSDRSPVGQDGTTTKWFKVEPIVWRVLTDSYNGKSLLLAENILTGGVPYYVDTNQRTIGSKTVYANNYQYSTVRAWLNGSYEGDDTQDKAYNGTGFLQSAFTTSAQGLIAETTVDNSAESTTDATGVLDKATNYACANTTDKVFLLSEKEATTDTYGFAAYNQADTTRIRFTTDYAKATGAYQSSSAGYGGWRWLRSPFYSNEYFARNIDYDGDANDIINLVYYAYGGVVPALCVQLQ